MWQNVFSGKAVLLKQMEEVKHTFPFRTKMTGKKRIRHRCTAGRPLSTYHSEIRGTGDFLLSHIFYTGKEHDAFSGAGSDREPVLSENLRFPS